MLSNGDYKTFTHFRLQHELAERAKQNFEDSHCWYIKIKQEINYYLFGIHLKADNHIGNF